MGGGEGRNLIQKLISFKVSKLKKGQINVLCETHGSDFKVNGCETCTLNNFMTFAPTVDGKRLVIRILSTTSNSNCLSLKPKL